jgi:outer membrane protein OmpA-like peptidoglycan-associated protein
MFTQLYNNFMKTFLSGIISICVIAGAVAQQPSLNNKQIQVKNESAVNSAQADYSPAFFEDGLVFISNRVGDKKLTYNDKNTKENTYSLFRAVRQMDGVLGKSEMFGGAVNTKLHEGPLSFNRTQDEMYFCQNNQKNGKNVKAHDGKVKMNIYIARFANGAWQYNQEPLFPDINNDYMHPYLSVDGRKLYFSSDRPGGLGGMDLYVSEWSGSAWGAPQNLGAPINTPGNEVFPFIHADGTLFFASDVPGGAGGFDVYYSWIEENLWALPVNFGAPVNTDKDDFGLILDADKKNGYFASNRPGGNGSDDIYSFYSVEKVGQKPKPASELLTVLFIDQLTGQKLPAACIDYAAKDELTTSDFLFSDDGSVVTIQEDGQGGSTLKPLESGTGCADSKGTMTLPFPAKPLVINASKPGYEPRQVEFVPQPDVKELTIPMLSMGKGKTPLSLSVVDPVTGKPIPGVAVKLVNDQTGEEMEVITDAKGNIQTTLPCGTSYTMTATRKKEVIQQRKIDKVPCDEPVKLTIDGAMGTPETLTEGTIIGLPNIYYNFNDHQIRPDAAKDLNQLVSIMKKYAELEIELGSHTDSRGSAGYNDTLSQKRAESAVAYMLREGVNRNRLSARGYGEQALINACGDGIVCSEFEHQRNRRTEVKIIKAPKNVKTEHINNEPTVVDPAPPSVIKQSGGGNVQMAQQTDVPAQTDTVQTNTQTAARGKLYTDKVVQRGKAKTFVLIAGSFASQENAQNQAKLVRSLGFDNVEARYERSATLVSVIIGPYTDVASAKNAAQTLLDNGIDVFLSVPK